MNVRDSSGDIILIENDDVPSEAKLPTEYGEFLIRVFHEESTGLDHVALTLGDMQGPDPVLIRVHSECLTGDAFASRRCDCGHGCVWYCNRMVCRWVYRSQSSFVCICCSAFKYNTICTYI